MESKPKIVFDVVCGMELDFSKVKQATEYDGGTYYFCSRSCRDHFEADPGKYVLFL